MSNFYLQSNDDFTGLEGAIGLGFMGAAKQTPSCPVGMKYNKKQGCISKCSKSTIYNPQTRKCVSAKKFVNICYDNSQATAATDWLCADKTAPVTSPIGSGKQTPVTCPAGFMMTSTGFCCSTISGDSPSPCLANGNTCPSGYLYETGVCMPGGGTTPGSCSIGYIWDAGIGACVGASAGCPAGNSINNIGQCITPGGQIYNPNSPVTPTSNVLTSPGCPTGDVFNGQQCVPNYQGLQCLPGYTWNGSTCAASGVVSNQCSSGSYWNGVQCVSQGGGGGGGGSSGSCPAGCSWNGELCINASGLECSGGTSQGGCVFNGELWIGQDGNECAGGGGGGAVPPSQCYTGYIWNGTTCVPGEVMPPQNCQAGYVWNGTACVSSGVNTGGSCPAGCSWNGELCINASGLECTGGTTQGGCAWNGEMWIGQDGLECASGGLQGLDFLGTSCPAGCAFNGEMCIGQDGNECATYGYNTNTQCGAGYSQQYAGGPCVYTGQQNTQCPSGYIWENGVGCVWNQPATQQQYGQCGVGYTFVNGQCVYAASGYIGGGNYSAGSSCPPGYMSNGYGGCESAVSGGSGAVYPSQYTQQYQPQYQTQYSGEYMAPSNYTEPLLMSTDESTY